MAGAKFRWDMTEPEALKNRQPYLGLECQPIRLILILGVSSRRLTNPFLSVLIKCQSRNVVDCK